MKPFLAGLLVPVLLAAACGGGHSATPDTGMPDAVLDVLPPTPSIETEVSTTAVKAGQIVDVSCVGNGFNPTQVELVVGLADSGTPPPANDATPGEDATPGAPDTSEYTPVAPPDLALPQGVTREGLSLRFTITDVYTVACYAPDANLLDPTPARIVVRPGAAASVETAVEPTDIKAGESVTVTCTGVDEYGNSLESAMTPGVTPPAGAKVQGMSVQLTKAGEVDIACGVKDTAVSDPTPVRVTVRPNLPKRIVTTVVPDTFEAGGSAALSCRAVDYYDNPVTDFPISVQVPAALVLAGKSLSGTLAGLYKVQCVPQTAEWKYFTLVPASVTVTPGPPSHLTLTQMPKKPYYGRNETLTVTAEARDDYGNLIPDAEVQAPVEISPTKGIVASTTSPTRVFTLKEEGTYRMTFRLAGYPTIYAELDVVVEGSGPLLTITEPERGTTAYDPAKKSVRLAGTVNDDQSGVTEVRYRLNRPEPECADPFLEPPNGCWKSLKVDPNTGSFSTVMVPRQGVNVVTVAARNKAGYPVQTSVGYQFSYKYYTPPDKDPTKSNVPGGALAFLSRDFIDDGQHAVPPPPDDLATILELVVANLNLSALLPNPLAEAGPYKVTIPSITYGKPHFDLNLYDGGLHLVMTIPNVKVDIKAEGRCEFIIDWCPDVSGNVTFDTLMAIADVDIGMDAQGALTATMKDVQVQLGGMQIHIDGLLGSLLDGIINLIVDAFRQTLTDTLVNQVSTMVNDLLGNLLSTLVIDQSFEIPALPGGTAKAIRIQVKPSTMNVRTEGIDVGLDGTISAVKGITHAPLGSIGRAGCLQVNPPKFELPWDQEVVIGAFDDLLNQALFSVWYGGSLNLRITQADLGDFESPIDIRDLKVDLDMYEAPILTDCNDKKALQAQVGDLYVFADLILLDNPLQLGAFVQATANVSLYLTTGATGGTAVAIRLDDIPVLDIEVVSINDDFPLTKDELMDMLKGQVLDAALAGVKGKELFAFELPSIDLSGLSPMLPPGLALNIGLRDLYRELGYTVIKGLLEQPPATP